jgi:hypothetical protein
MTTEHEEKFTPGPWEYRKSGRVSIAFNIWAGAALLGEAAREPNARMMAAAPEMYQALSDLLAWANIREGSRDYHLAESAKAALAKARGGQ